MGVDMSREDDHRISQKINKRWLEENDITDITAGPLTAEVTPSSLQDYLATDWQSDGRRKRRANIKDKYNPPITQAETLWKRGDTRDGYQMALYLRGLKKGGGDLAYDIQKDGELRELRRRLRDAHPDRFPDTPSVGGAPQKMETCHTAA